MLRVRVSPAAIRDPGKVPQATDAQAAKSIEAAASFFRRDDNGWRCPTKGRSPLDSIHTNRGLFPDSPKQSPTWASRSELCRGRYFPTSHKIAAMIWHVTQCL